ncbi:MAG: hypothetical protein ACSLE0_12660 [Chitinophagaceae bacterium]
MHYFKNIKFTAFLTLLFLLGRNFPGYGQQDMVNTMVKNLNTYNQQNWQEKIFIHTDRSFYTCGEIMWFKLYNVDAALNKPVTISKIAYIELLNNEQKPIFQAQVELK